MLTSYNQYFTFSIKKGDHSISYVVYYIQDGQERALLDREYMFIAKTTTKQQGLYYFIDKSVNRTLLSRLNLLPAL